MPHSKPDPKRPKRKGIRDFSYEAIHEIFEEIVSADRRSLLKRAPEGTFENDFVSSFIDEINAEYEKAYQQRPKQKTRADLRHITAIKENLDAVLQNYNDLSPEALEEVCELHLSKSIHGQTPRPHHMETVTSKLKRVFAEEAETPDQAEQFARLTLNRLIGSINADPVRLIIRHYLTVVELEGRWKEQDLPKAKAGRPPGSVSKLVGDVFANAYFTLTGEKVGYSTDGDEIKLQGFALFAYKLKNEIDPTLSLEVLVKGRSRKDRSKYATEKIRRFS
jgi:hypothetical protein